MYHMITGPLSRLRDSFRHAVVSWLTKGAVRDGKPVVTISPPPAPPAFTGGEPQRATVDIKVATRAAGADDLSDILGPE